MLQVPHFEIMLYDQPQLAATYLAAFQVTGDRAYAATARGVLDYLLRDLAHPEVGGSCRGQGGAVLGEAARAAAAAGGRGCGWLGHPGAQ